ncbi:hypothetical protein ABG067_003691 [Albugo candida]
MRQILDRYNQKYDVYKEQLKTLTTKGYMFVVKRRVQLYPGCKWLHASILKQKLDFLAADCNRGNQHHCGWISMKLFRGQEVRYDRSQACMDILDDLNMLTFDEEEKTVWVACNSLVSPVSKEIVRNEIKWQRNCIYRRDLPADEGVF